MVYTILYHPKNGDDLGFMALGDMKKTHLADVLWCFLLSILRYPKINDDLSISQLSHFSDGSTTSIHILQVGILQARHEDAASVDFLGKVAWQVPMCSGLLGDDVAGLKMAGHLVTPW